uniref:Uncharacterized protein n=1 Tax=Marseillevirus LCMAC101 TaxID=2506602 RepID=A0A481YSI3_9VIRU|nr:MAG: uncharacterized protein LCMAC101_00110 [Marseillevirus LCMAC101]
MSTADGYVHEIKSLRKEIKRLNEHMKTLRDQKNLAEDRLYQYMKKNGIEKLDGVTIGSIKPRSEHLPRKKKSEKKRDAVELFEQIGVSDPEGLWTEFQATQRYQDREEVPHSQKSKGKGYDPYLGF